MEHRASTNDVHAGRAAVKSKFSLKSYFKSQMTKIIMRRISVLHIMFTSLPYRFTMNLL